MPHYRPLCALALALLVPWPAAAQMTATVETVAGVDPGAYDPRINVTTCVASTTISLRLDNITSTKQVLDFWRGTGCDAVPARTPVTQTCDPLTLSIDTTIRMNTRLTFPIPVTELLDCAAGDARYTIYVLGALMSATAEDVAGDFASFVIELDSTPPLAPTGVSGGSGNTQIPVGWTPGNPLEPENYRVYVDTNCSPTSLMAGAVADPALLRATAPRSSTSTDLNGAALGLTPGQSVAVAVTAVDLAGNESVLSNVTCVTRVATDGFCAVNESMGGRPCDSCTIVGAGLGGKGALPLFAVLVAAIALARRRPW